MTGRYNIFIRILHWLMAVSFVGLIAGGLWMTEAINVPETQMTAFEIYQLHKSVGLTLLTVVWVRLLLRFITTTPDLRPMLGDRDIRLAHLGHAALYGAMIVVPLLGWAMVSASVWNLPTIWFGVVEWPHIAPLAALDRGDKESVEALLKSAHRYGAYGFIVLISGHILAALKHQMKDGVPLLERMALWSRKSQED